MMVRITGLTKKGPLGLMEKEAEQRRQEYGYNEIRELIHVSPLRILFRQVKKNFMVYLLLAAMLISFFIGKSVTAYTILVIVIILISVGFTQEYRAERAIKALKQMIVPVSVALRNGREKEVPSRELVPGDVIVLRSGEKIPADSLILEEKELLVNEAVLTGESKEVRKSAARSLKGYREENVLFMGTLVVSGRAVAKVLRTGMNTQFGKVAGLISTAEKELPLQNKANTITKYMAGIAILISVISGSIMLWRGLPFSFSLLAEVLIVVIALSVSAFPEGFPVVLITTLAVGAHRMARKNAIVNRMSIMETLGETTIICADKTGTITKGEMTVKKLYLGGQVLEVGGAGYEAVGEFECKGRKIEPATVPTLSLLLRAAVICNDSRIERKGTDREYRAFGSPTETALLVLAAKANIFREDLKFIRVEEIPFSSERKLMSVVSRESRQDYVYVKGAPEILLERCKLSTRERREILAANKQFTTAGYRTLALAYKKSLNKKKLGKIDPKTDKKNLEEGLLFLGLAAIEDPPREEVRAALKLCATAGIKVKMMTGDDRNTAITIGRQIGLTGRVLEGRELDKLTDDELVKAVKSVAIFVRVRPEHKLRIVKALKRNREIVTMTGDGVNDAPSLKEAHIGVAMGKNGTDVSREAADLTLKDDNFSTIVSAIAEGRTIFSNIRKFLTYQLSCNYAELLIIFLAVVLGLPLPLLALQILFMNMVTDDLPAMTLGFNPPPHDVMKVKPRKNSALLNKNLLLLLVLAGTIMALATLGVFYFVLQVLGQELAVARTTALVTLIFFEISNAFNFRSFRSGVHELPLLANKHLVWASFLSILATILIIYTPLHSIFETTAIRFSYWLLALACSLSIIVIFDLLKILHKKKGGLLFGKG